MQERRPVITPLLLLLPFLQPGRGAYVSLGATLYARTRLSFARSPSAVALAATKSSDELKAELLTLVRQLPERGRLAFEADVMPWEVEAVQTCVNELEHFDPAARDGWMYSEDFCGDWELRYTSSRAFHRNEGATGYAASRPGCVTPELILRIDAPRLNWITLEEPVLRSGADAAVAGDVMSAECLWQAGAADVLRMEPMLMRDPNGREWKPRDSNVGDEVDMNYEKAIRVLTAVRPVYLDDGLLVMRSAVLEETLFVWTRKGVDDPPAVELASANDASDEVPAAIKKMLEARDAPRKDNRPRSGNVFGPGGRP